MTKQAAPVEPWMREAAKAILHAGSWPDEWESEDVTEIAEIIAAHSLAKGTEPPDFLTIAAMICMKHDVAKNGEQVLPSQLAAYMKDVYAEQTASSPSLPTATPVCQNPLHAQPDGTPEPHDIGPSCMAEVGDLKFWATRARAARTKWLESRGVPISIEFANFAEAIGTLIKLAESSPAGAATADCDCGCENETCAG